LKPGQRICVTQTVRIGCTANWAATVEGVFRLVNYLATGLATDRVPEDDIVVITVHFIKDNGELSSVTLDENTRIERVSA
jgi:azurin